MTEKEASSPELKRDGVILETRSLIRSFIAADESEKQKILYSSFFIRNRRKQSQWPLKYTELMENKYTFNNYDSSDEFEPSASNEDKEDKSEQLKSALSNLDTFSVHAYNYKPQYRRDDHFSSLFIKYNGPNTVDDFGEEISKVSQIADNSYIELEIFVKNLWKVFVFQNLSQKKLIKIDFAALELLIRESEQFLKDLLKILFDLRTYSGHRQTGSLHYGSSSNKSKVYAAIDAGNWETLLNAGRVLEIPAIVLERTKKRLNDIFKDHKVSKCGIGPRFKRKRVKKPSLKKKQTDTS